MHRKGLTLLELMVVLAIVIGLVMTAIPLGREFYLKNQLENRANTLVFTIKYAKQQALLRNETLVLSALTDKEGWSKGMRLFIANAHHPRYEEGDKVIREWHWPKGLPVITWRGFVSTHYLRFSPSIKQAALNGHFLLQLPDLKEGGTRKIVINRLGRVRTETT